jgi:hypothetical protein
MPNFEDFTWHLRFVVSQGGLAGFADTINTTAEAAGKLQKSLKGVAADVSRFGSLAKPEKPMFGRG